MIFFFFVVSIISPIEDQLANDYVCTEHARADQSSRWIFDLRENVFGFFFSFFMCFSFSFFFVIELRAEKTHSQTIDVLCQADGEDWASSSLSRRIDISQSIRKRD